MNIKFSNPFLFFLTTLFYLWSWFTTSLFPSFMCGICFGLIFQNGIDEKNNN